MLAEEERVEVRNIVREVVYQDSQSLKIQQQQWKKFKESPEARLAALEVKVEAVDGKLNDFIQETIRNFDQIDKRFDAVDKRFDAMDRKFDAINNRFEDIHKILLDMHKMINMQVWKFLAGISGLAIILKLIDKLL